jgi:hypothetical protein
MLQQILFRIFNYFLLWTLVLSLQLTFGMFTYEASIFRATTAQIRVMTQEF